MPYMSKNNRNGTDHKPATARAAAKGQAAQNGPSSAGRGGTTASVEFQKLQGELCAKKAMFEDPDFPAVDASIFFSQKPPKPFEWLRPHQICDNPKFIADGASRFDVRQGELGDCWLLAAVASLSMHSNLFEQVIPSDQDFTTNYCGMLRFRFWRFGEWKEIIVDDRLPTKNKQLCFMHSTEKNEFWSALLEKAYAKLFGSYEALKGGSQSEAMEDFTSGITEHFELQGKEPKNLLDIMLKAVTRSSLMGCSIEADPGRVEAELPNGLIMGHAYSVTDVKMVEVNLPDKKGKVPLVRVRNPWGNEAEWKGAWGDKSREWSLISDAEKKNLGLSCEDDGEFWMSYQDFVSNFQKIEICNLGPQAMSEQTSSGKAKTKWEMCLENGQWKKKVSAGGCRNFIETFWTNPQFRIKIVDADDGDDEDLGTVIIGLMQKDMRKRRREGAEMNTVGYAIYKLPDPNAPPLDLKFFKYNASVARSPNFINLREVCGRHRLPPGDYTIVPSTFEPNMEADFLLRIFSEKPNESGEIDDATDFTPVQNDKEKAPELKEPGQVAKDKPPKDLTPEEESQVKALRETFRKVAGVDLEVDAYELLEILNAAFKKEFNFDGFQIETCRSMVAMMDVDQSGKLGFDEFKTLWNDLRIWKAVFKKYDTDHSGTFNSYELRQALKAVGFSVSNSIFNSLVMRYASQDGHIQFDEFVLCCTRLKTIFETFKAQEKDTKGRAVFDMDSFIRAIMYV